MQKFVEKNIRRVNRNYIIKIIIILSIVSFFSYFFKNYFYNLFAGPFTTTSEQIYSIYDIKDYPKPFVQFQANDPIETGFIEIEQKINKNTKAIKEEKTTGNILATLVEDKILLINSETTNHTNTYIGSLKTHSNVTNEVIADLEKEMPELKGKFLNFYLDETDKPNWIGFIILMILSIYVIWRLYRTILWIKNPEQHPIKKNIKLYGNHDDISRNIDNEIDQKVKFNEILITKSWLFKPERYNLLILRLDDIVWIYKKVTSHFVNFIPQGKTYGVVFKTWRDQEIDVKLSNKKSDELLNMFVQKMPHVIFGFTKELEKLWKMNPIEFLSYIKEQKNNSKKK